MRRLHQANFVVFLLSLLGVFGGLAVFGLWPLAGEVMMYTGFAVLGLILLESYVIYPRLRCPRCQHRFFLPDGRWHWFYRINLRRSRCLHCGLSLSEHA